MTLKFIASMIDTYMYYYTANASPTFAFIHEIKQDITDILLYPVTSCYMENEPLISKYSDINYVSTTSESIHVLVRVSQMILRFVKQEAHGP